MTSSLCEKPSAMVAAPMAASTPRRWPNCADASADKYALTHLRRYAIITTVMRTTIDIPDPMLRQIKSKCALEGRTMRGVTMLFFQNWLDGGSASLQILDAEPIDIAPQPAKKSAREKPSHDDMPPWFGIAASHIRHDVPHDMASIRASIAKGRAAEWAERERRIREGVE